MLLSLYTHMQTRLAEVRDNERGATAVEYGLIIALIAAAIVVIVGLLGTQVKDAFQTVCNAIKKSACA